MNSASTAHESAKSRRESSGERDHEMEDLSPMNEFNDPAAGDIMMDPSSGNDLSHGRDYLVEKAIKFKFGDKFTKKPLQVGKYLILLGRIHIQVFDLESFQTKIILSGGEDQAEKLGQLLKSNPEMLQKALEQ